MLAPDDYTQPVQPVAAAGRRGNNEIDSKIESKGAGPKMISFTLPAFGLVGATVLIGFACAFVVGRMTNTPAQAANVEPADLPPTPVDALQDSNNIFDIAPETTAVPATVAGSADTAAATAGAAAAGVPAGALWGFQVMQYKLADKGETLAATYKSNLQDKGFTDVFLLKKNDTVAVIVGADPSYRSLCKAWKDKLVEKGQRADPVKFTGDQIAK